MKLLPGREDHTTTPGATASDATAAVSALYAEHALGLTRLAQVMLGDRSAAEDVVHDAFCGLYRRWEFLTDTGKALQYLRSSVLNGCRTALRRGTRPAGPVDVDLTIAASAEHALLTSEERHAVMAALRQLPGRQRETLVLRYYLDLPDAEIARSMGIRESTVRSTVHRGLASLERILTGESS
jgi:RNA polymerase sigma-70 factor (sigma-E family)